MTGLLKRGFIISTILGILSSTAVKAQYTYPAVTEDGSLNMSSPDGQSTSGGSGGSVDLATGTAQATIPVYVVKCGSLQLPISLNYSYNGFQPITDATWVGLGWSLSAGGMINRAVQGAVDSSRVFGKNYGQYSIKDSLIPSANPKFINNLYLNDHDTSYDPAPDIFSASFNGYAVQFYWYKGKPYMLSYNKEVKIIWPDVTGGIIIVTGDGTRYVFGGTQNVLMAITEYHQVKDYSSAYYLTSVISADGKDTINLNYSGARYTPPVSALSVNYVQGTYTPDGLTSADSINLEIGTISLSSITCRTTTVNFVQGSAPRTDLLQALPYALIPSLREIDVIDNVTATTVNKNRFSYGYFGNPSATPTSSFLRLKLKTFSRVNVATGTDSLTYSFSYLNENGTNYPGKTDPGLDEWGYYVSTSGYVFDLHDHGRNPNFTYCSFAALDTIVYPTRGYSTYSYELNDFDSSATQHHAFGPGIRVNKITQFLPGATVPASSTTYAYLADNGTSSSGSVSHTTITTGPLIISDSVNVKKYVINNNSPGTGALTNVFYYTKVSQKSAAGGEIHRTDNYFKSFSNLFSDIELTSQIQYRYDSVLSTYSPVTSIVNNIDTTTDSTFIILTTYIDSASPKPPSGVAYRYGYAYYNTSTYWKRINNRIYKAYDVAGDSSTITTYYYYNAARNNDSMAQVFPDGRRFTDKFKRSEDYTTALTGKLVAAHLIDPLLEQQNWVKYGAGAPRLVSGIISTYDTTKLKPITVYALETAAPVGSLKNETLTGGLYNTLISDTSLYVLKTQFNYDGNNLLSQSTPVSNFSTSYLYNYHHSIPVATVTTAAAALIAYTSFESDGNGNWTVPSAVRDSTYAMTGIASYNLSKGNITMSGLSTSLPYVVSYWSRNGSYTVNSVTAGLTGKTTNGWTYYEHVVSSVTSVTVAGSGNIDELRLYPVNAQMTTHTYIPTIGMTSVCSANNHIQYYEYDGYGRLKVIRDEDRNIIKLYDYENQVSPHPFFNLAQQVNFNRNNCAICLVGSTVTYTVPAGMFSSLTSQADAQAQALAYGNANGQAYANANGTCSTPATGPITATNSTTSTIMVAFVNNCTGHEYDFSLGTSTGTNWNTVPQGTYTVSIGGGTATTNYNVNGFSQTGSSASFGSIPIVSGYNFFQVH